MTLDGGNGFITVIENIETEDIGPKSLAVEATTLCDGMSPREAVGLMEGAERYGLQVEIPREEDVKKWLSGEIPNWYTPSTLYSALTGDRSHGRKPIKVCPELAELLGEYAAEVGRSPVFRSTELEHAEKFARLMSVPFR